MKERDSELGTLVLRSEALLRRAGRDSKRILI